MQKTLIKGNSVVIENLNNEFIYEASVRYYGKNYFSVVNSKLFKSSVELKSLVKHFFFNRKIEFYTELIEAPLNWALDNGYIIYIKPDKKIKILKN